jgi:hypothetical protein
MTAAAKAAAGACDPSQNGGANFNKKRRALTLLQRSKVSQN